MKTILTAGCLILNLFISISSRAAIAEDSVTYGKFGKVMLYKPETTASQVVLFISGDGGWKSGVVDMARRLSAQGALVMGIDILRYNRALKKENAVCYYISGDFETLNEVVQKKLNFKHFITPILAGYSSGATMAYALLAQAPDNTYKGALALGFDPGIEIGKPLCVGSGLHSTPVPHGYSLLPRPDMSAVFVVLNGDLDKFWEPEKGKAFLSALKYSRLYELPGVGHGFTQPKHWVPQFISGYRYIISNYSPPVPHNITASLKTLPIIEVPAKTKDMDMPLMIIYSGDGGWRGFIDKIAVDFSDRGIPVVGVDVLKYFWEESSPEKSAKDLAAIIEYYLHNWHRKKVILAGYSFGADVIPFIYDKLPADIQARVSLLDLMSPSGYADFTFHFTSWLDENSSQNYKVSTLLNTIVGPKIVVIFGKDEIENLSTEIKNKMTRIILVNGDHHYNYNQGEVVLPVMEAINDKKTIN